MSRLTTVVLGLTSAALTVTGGLAAGTATSGVPTTQVAAAAGDPALTSAIDTILADPRFNGSMVSVAVRDAATERSTSATSGSGSTPRPT